MPDDTQADLSQTVAALRRELDTRTTERDEALAREAAIAEVLQVINSSPGDPVPVFQAIVEKAHTLGSAVCGSLQLWDGEKFRGVAMRGFSEAMVEALRQGYSPGPNHPCHGLIDGHRIAHCIDMAEVDDPATQLGAKFSGIRTVACVALRKDDALLGQIVAGRLEVRPYTDAELALLENFAAQAVIAMENARLLTETREALEQQTATSEILSVISRSPTDIRPVFEAIVARAASLCEAEFGAVARFEDGLLHLAALHSMSPAEAAAFHSLFPRPPARKFAMGRAFVDARPAHLKDALADLDYDPRTIEVLQSVAGYRSFPGGTDLPGGQADRPRRLRPASGQALHRDPDRAPRDLRRPGRHRHRERASVQQDRDPQSRPRRGLGAADGDRRSVAGH
jgi:GAF domain-containing protein